MQFNYPDSLAYASVTDVQNILGSISYNSDIAQDSGYINTLISEATQHFETETAKRFCPVRHIERLDGTGRPSLILQHSPILSLNVIKNYINAQLLSVNQPDYTLTIERENGIVRIPLSYTTSASVQFTQSFYRGNRNILADYWSGYGKQVFGETLTTANNQTYVFANTTLAPTLYEQFGPIATTPPIYRPIVYVNGVQQINTTFQYSTLASGNSYNVIQDNIVYTTNFNLGTITFNAPLSGAVVTSDYEYYYIPSDITRSVAKLAAIQVLKTEGVGAGGKLGQGTSQFQMDGYKAVYGKQDAFPFEGLITSWTSDVEKTIAKYQRRTPNMTSGFYAF